MTPGRYFKTCITTLPLTHHANITNYSRQFLYEHYYYMSIILALSCHHTKIPGFLLHCIVLCFPGWGYCMVLNVSSMCDDSWWLLAARQWYKASPPMRLSTSWSSVSTSHTPALDPTWPLQQSNSISCCQLPWLITPSDSIHSRVGGVGVGCVCVCERESGESDWVCVHVCVHVCLSRVCASLCLHAVHV